MNDANKLFNTDLGLLILRVSVGGLMLFHGVAKLIHGHHHIKDALAKNDLPEFLWLGVPLTEVVGPILLVLGILTRLSGLGITLVMIFAIVLFIGTGTAFSINQFGGLTAELNLLFLFGGLALFFTGGGKFVLYKSKREWLN